jgi:acetyltransferase
MKPPAISYTCTDRDGHLVTIRPIQAEDREIEVEFVRGLSAKAKYMRFFTVIKDLTPQLLDRFTRVDFPDEMAFIATVDSGSGEQEIGVARYVPGGIPGVAEFAVVVADAWQGHGVGRELMRHLIMVAEDAGFKRIEGAVLKANTNMLHFCRELGFVISRCEDDPQLVVAAKDF